MHSVKLSCPNRLPEPGRFGYMCSEVAFVVPFYVICARCCLRHTDGSVMPSNRTTGITSCEVWADGIEYAACSHACSGMKDNLNPLTKDCKSSETVCLNSIGQVNEMRKILISA